jgi:single-stranded-DNA-specific exonuclease
MYLNLRTEIRADFFGVAGKVVFVAFRSVLGEDPDMRVCYFVADDFRENPVGAKGLLLCLRYFSDHFKIVSDIRHIPDPSVMLFRDNLGVSRSLRVYVEEGEKVFIFVHLVRGYFSRDNFAKNTFARAHCFSSYNLYPILYNLLMFPLHDPLDEIVRAELAAYDDLTAALLARRGVLTRDGAEKFLNPSYDLHLHDPFLMTDMSLAAKRLGTAILSGERIAVWSDYDCDGIPGGVLLHDFLAKAGANFENYIPHRHAEGYGMNVDGIESLAKNGVRLIVTVDSGITDIEPITRANELGMEVVVTDHHLPRLAEAESGGGSEIILPPAFAILNPNARTDETYPFHELCGAGVAWKLVCATLATEPSLRERVPEGWEKWLLDMVGLATIADMVPLVGENRVLAAYGLLVMRKSPRIGLQKLCRAIRVDQRTLTEDDVGFMIVPRVNAASRMDDARDAFRLFTTADESEADSLVKKLEAANRGRRADAGAITRAVRERLRERTEIRSIIALGDPEWRPALLGLVANTVADEYERPVFLWGREGNLSLKGSVRSGGATHALALMRAAENIFVEFGGHAAAGGFTVRDTEIFFLEDRLVEAHSRMTAEKIPSDALALRADIALAPEEATSALLKKIERLAPFGQQNQKPVFLLREIIVREISHFGKGEEHLKLKIEVRDEGETLDAVAFFAKGPVARAAGALARGSRASILVHLERDTFSRKNSIRLRLLDIKLV